MNALADTVQARFNRIGQHPAAARFIATAPVWITALLVVAVAWQLSGLIWSLFPQRMDSPVAGAPRSTAPSARTKETPDDIDVNPIVNAHLFGIASAEPEIAEGPAIIDDNVRISREPLILRGTLAANTENDAIAIIAEGREENVFRINDTVKRGITLHAVQTTQVILNNNGSLEALKLPEQESSAARAPSQRVSRQRAAAAPSISQVLTNNASSLTQVIQPRPYFVGGKQRGYRLYPGRDRKQFSQLGLRPGDIVTEINGTPLTNPTEGAKIFTALGDAQSITVTLERNGSPQQLTLDVSQLDIEDASN